MFVNKNVFWEFNAHLLHDVKPSQYLNLISKEPIFNEYPFNMLSKLKQTEQSPKHHPEGNVWNHTMLVIDQAAKVKGRIKDSKSFMWAAILHDIGKADTTKNIKGKITAYDHDKLGAKLARSFLEEFTDDTIFIDKVSVFIRWHMQILYVVNNLPFADIKTMKQQIDIDELALFGLCDRLGRLNPDRKKEEKNISIFIEKCKK